MAELGRLGVGVGARRGGADLGPRLLQGHGRQPDVLVGEVLARVAEAFLGEGTLQDLQRLGEAFAALAIVNAVGLVGVGEARAADAEDQAAFAELVDGGDLLGRDAADGRAAAPARPCRSSCARCVGRWWRRSSSARRAPSVRARVQLGEPHRVEAPRFGSIDLGQRVGEGLLRRFRRAAPETRGTFRIPSVLLGKADMV